QPEVTLGILAAAGGTRRLPALVGLAHARRLLFSGAVIDAAEALRIGLVDRVVADADVPRAVAELLAPILAAAPEAVRQTQAARLETPVRSADRSRDLVLVEKARSALRAARALAGAHPDSAASRAYYAVHHVLRWRYGADIPRGHGGVADPDVLARVGLSRAD